MAFNLKLKIYHLGHILWRRRLPLILRQKYLDLHGLDPQYICNPLLLIVCFSVAFNFDCVLDKHIRQMLSLSLSFSLSPSIYIFVLSGNVNRSWYNNDVFVRDLYLFIFSFQRFFFAPFNNKRKKEKKVLLERLKICVYMCVFSIIYNNFLIYFINTAHCWVLYLSDVM